MYINRKKAKFNMKDKLILKEDLDLELPSYEGLSIEDIYEDQGIDVFSETNIPLLKQAGLINEFGYPVDKYEGWNGEMKTRPMSMGDISRIDENFIDSPYIRELAINDILSNATKNDSGEIIIEFTDDDLQRIGDMSEDFIVSCFSGDLWDYFSGYGDYSFNDVKYNLNDIPSEVLDTLESYGFPRDIYNQLMDGTADEDSPLAKWYDDLKSALVNAYRQGEEDGSAFAAEKDFDKAFKESMPEGVTWDEQESTASTRPLIVSKKFLEDNLKGIWDELDIFSSSMYYSFEHYLKEMINDNLDNNFDEPYYGWQDFDAESFGDRLLEEIVELEIPEQVDFEPENSLLNFNGETGEYHEDLDLDIEIQKPKKLFYRYKEFNPELSSKAYMLDPYRLQLLVDFLKATPSDDVDTYARINLQDYLEDALYNPEEDTNIILSSIKPSFQTSRGPGYSIWAIPIGYTYDTEYLGFIPKHIGDEILKHGKISEDIELDVVPIPDIKMGPDNFTGGHTEEELINIVANKHDKSGWVLQIYDAEFDEWENKYLFTDLNSAYEIYNEWDSPDEDDYILLVYVPSEEEVNEENLDYSYIVCGKFGSGKQKSTL